MSSLRLLAVASVCAAVAAAQAQTAPNALDPVLVTGTRSPLQLSRALADVTVIERADIERQGFGNLADLLSRQACIEIVRNGNPGASTSLYLRGANTQHTLLLVDGVRVDAQGGSGGAPWEAIPLAQIERIEIVRGAASALYGSDALAGVIQVFTRKGEGAPSLQAGAALGSLGLVKGDLNLSGRHENLDYALGAAAERADGFNARKVLNDPSYTPDRDDWRSHSLQGRLGWQAAAGQRLEGLFSLSEVDAGYDAAAKPAPGVNDRSVNDTRAARLLWASTWNTDLRSELSGGRSRQRYETLSNGRSSYLTETEVSQWAAQGSWRLGASQLNALLERREDRLVNNGLRADTGGQADRSQNALGLSWLYSHASWDAQLHARHDRDSEFGGVNTGSAALGWRFAPGWRAWASAGSAFRAPTLYQVFSEYGPKAGQAALAPERGRNRELGLRWSGAASELGLTAFDNRIRELISWDGGFVGRCDSPWGCYGNLAKVRLRGVSLQGQTLLAGWRLQAGLDWQDPSDALTGKRLGRRAKQLGAPGCRARLAGPDGRRAVAGARRALRRPRQHQAAGRLRAAAPEPRLPHQCADAPAAEPGQRARQGLRDRQGLRTGRPHAAGRRAPEPLKRGAQRSCTN
jgi:vitamin B12 transporter